MVKQRQLAYARRNSRVDHVLDRAMTPADPRGILLGSVLCIVDNQIGIREELGVPGVLAGHGLLLDLLGHSQSSRVWLVVGRVNQRDPIGLQPVTERERGMIQILRSDPDVTDLEDALDEVVIAHVGAEIFQCKGKIRVLHLPSQSLAHGPVGAVRAIDIPLAGGYAQRCEEGKALDVIPVGVCDQDVTVLRGCG